MLEQFTILAEGLDHPEGTAWSPDGHLFAGGEAGQIYVVTLDGAVEHVLRDLNGNMILVLFPLNIMPAAHVDGVLHQLRVSEGYELNRSKLPQGG